MAMEIGMVESWNKDGFLIQAFIKLTFHTGTKKILDCHFLQKLQIEIQNDFTSVNDM